MGFRFESLDNNYIPPQKTDYKKSRANIKERNSSQEKRDKLSRAFEAQNNRLKIMQESDWYFIKRMAKKIGSIMLSVSLTTGVGLKIGEYLEKKDKESDKKTESYAQIDENDSPSRQMASELMAKHGVKIGEQENNISSQTSINSGKTPPKQDGMFSCEGPKQQIEKKAEKQIETIPDLRKIIKYKKNGRIIYNMDTAREITAGWKLKHEKEPVYKNSFDFAIKKLAPYKEAMEQEFEKAGVPIEFVFLSVPESYWNDKPSEKGAIGPFQITKDIGRQFKMIINDKIDERHNPVKSARVAAELLKDNYNKLGQNWNLALSAYNGGMVWKYAALAKSKGEKLSYEEYLKYKEEEINKRKNEIEKYVKIIEIKKAITIYELAKQHETNIETVKKLNNIKSDKLKHGQKIKLPLGDKEKEKLFYDQVAGENENLNYPPRYVGVVSLVKEKGIDKAKYESINFRIVNIKQPKIGIVSVVRAGKKDTIETIAKKYKVSKEAILSVNGFLKHSTIKTGTKINIPDKNIKLMNLFAAADLHGVPFIQLHESNKEIIDPTAPLPDGWELKINTKILYAKNYNRQK